MVAAAIDWDTGFLLNKITYPALPVFFILSMVLNDDPLPGALGMLIGFGLLWLTSRGYYLITRRVGMGDGDLKLMAVIGAMVGVDGVTFTLVSSGVLGILYALISSSKKGSLRHLSIRYGPFLAAGSVLFLITRHWVNCMDVLVNLFR